MAQLNWLPTLWGEQEKDDDNPFLALRKQIDSMFEDFDRGALIPKGGFKVRSNVSETDSEICITAELPGIEKKDIDISITGNQITIKGEKKEEKEEKKEEEGRHFHRIERSSGSFQRSMTLPFDVDADTIKAEIDNGVLTVTIPKPPEVLEKTKKIEIK